MGRLFSSFEERPQILELFPLDGVTPFIVVGETITDNSIMYTRVMSTSGGVGWVMRNSLSLRQNQFKGDSLNRLSYSRRRGRKRQWSPVAVR